jgi:hypothetical protein
VATQESKLEAMKLLEEKRALASKVIGLQCGARQEG